MRRNDSEAPTSPTTIASAPVGESQLALMARYASGRERLKLTWLLAALAMLGPFSIDTYLPAFPTMEAACCSMLS